MIDTKESNRAYDAILKIAKRSADYLSAHHSSYIYRKLGVKTRLFVDGQASVLDAIKQDMQHRGSKPLYWVHAASLGEFGIARPIMNELRKKGNAVVLTFFSSTGVEALRQKSADYTGADYVYYLPLDTHANAVKFLDAVKPDKAVIVKSELWINYLMELYRRNIPTYLISAYITPRSSVYKWYGGMFRSVLKVFTKIYTQDEESVQRLAEIGYHNAIVMGDPLYDNAVENSKREFDNKIIEHFCQTAPQGVMIAGSIDIKHDLKLIAPLISTYLNCKFIVVPHEVDKKHLAHLLPHLPSNTMLYSECSAETDFSETNVLVIDYVGDLAKIYRYGRWAYVGGGFTSLLHSVVEPAVYGLPVSFGPRIDRKAAPHLMIKHGIGQVVRNVDELARWFEDMLSDKERVRAINERAKAFVHESAGKTMLVVQELTNS